ncbi:glycosyltransferase [Helicobacter mustelae]|uniref:glycosyltransferase n=1 Tax=Helicobacter mustelae TaxID=217 RepID=UPI000E063798|nr:glycosyltransferase [Helicobacter mustelae]STP11952.1 glycosyltransferase [Helicobacter mustelae]
MQILVLCAANIAKNPRPSRMVGFLKDAHQVSAMGIASESIDGALVRSYSPYKKRNFLQEIGLYCNVFLHRWDRLVYTHNRLEIVDFLKERCFDVIICHDLVLLPIVLAYKKSAKVIFDAREFYPKQCSNNLRWRILFAGFNHFLCKTYLKKADKILTVSQGLQKAYMEQYGINSEVFYSLSKFYDLKPHPIEENTIKIIYHGSANPERQIEKTIEIMDYCQNRFSLDLMLVCQDPKYQQKLQKMVEERQKRGCRIRIIPPVPFEEIVPFSSQYDIGLYALPKANFNLEFTIPNKFFEYIQARLALVVIPNSEMQEILQKYQNGVVARSYAPKEIASTINALTHEEIKRMKKNSDKAAEILNSKHNQLKIKRILHEITQP